MRRGIALLLVTVLVLQGGPIGAQGDTVPVDPQLSAASTGERSVIVSFEGPPSASTLDLLIGLGTLHHVYSIIDAAHVTLPVDNIDEVARLSGVTRLDADEALELHLDTSRPAVQVDERLWRRANTGSDATIAVVDTGIDSQHPSVEGRVVRSVTFTGSGSGPVESNTGTDTDGHGTHVAGITAGTGSNSKVLDPEDDKYAGLAPDAGLVSLDISASFTTSTAIRAFEWVHDNHEQYGIEVVQNSWGRKETGQAYDKEDPAVQASNALVFDDDLVVVFSAANEGPNPQTLSMEAMNPNVLTVGATDDSGKIAEFSSRGPVPLPDGSIAEWTKPDIVAPGVQIRSAAATQDGTSQQLYKGLSGTSQAAPHAAGVAALIRSEVPDLPTLDVIEAMETSARDLGPAGPDPTTGHGFLQAAGALEIALNATAGSLSSERESFTAEGRIVAGAPTGDILPQDTGVEGERANGSIPVHEGAETFVFRFNWSSPNEAPPPDLRVRLTDPSGREVLVPTEDRSAMRRLQAPVTGSWSWEASPSSDTEAGVAEYELNATVTLASQERLSDNQDGDGGYFDDSVSAQAERYIESAREAYGDGPVFAALAVLAVLLLAMLVGVVRRVRG